MELIFEVVFELLGELALLLFVQIFGELGANVIAAYRSRGPRLPFVSAIGHALAGGGFGWLSLLMFPYSFAHTDTMRLIALIGSPLLAGLGSALIGSWRRRSGRGLVLFETFTYGFLFAFAFALVRYLWTS
jgi:hypothetical protein